MIVLLSKEEQSYYDQNVFFEDFINNHSKQPYSDIFISDKSCEDKEAISFSYPGYKEKCEEKKCQQQMIEKMGDFYLCGKVEDIQYQNIKELNDNKKCDENYKQCYY